jgi:carboxypeptidase Q
VSAHLDSWNGPGSQGTTDNGTGSSVTLEAARILATVGAKPKRTIRFILWTGEEQGLLGSRAYVEQLKEKDQLKNVSACFVDDGGTNFEGGLNCFNSQVELLGAATAPINGVFWSSTDNRYLDVNIKPVDGGRLGRVAGGGGSDHQSFIAAGVPGFFWDEIGRADYPYGWHTQHDKLDLAIPEYLMQSSTCAAVTAYNLACAPTLLPREPLPKPEEKKDTTASVTTP